MTAGVTSKAAHVSELDGVRGIAIAMVMALHFVCTQITAPESYVERLAAKLTGYGTWGVDLFFVLSGYLITGILADSRGAKRYYSAFYARRTLRIFPLYYAVLVVLLWIVPNAIVVRHVPLLAETRALQAWLWPYLTNVYVGMVGDFTIPYVSHFWTLAVEEHFYLVWPFVVRGLSRTAAMSVCVGAGLAALSLRYLLSVQLPGTLFAEVLTPCRLDSLCAGAWFALASRGATDPAALRRRARQIGIIAAAGVLATSVWHVLQPAAKAPESLRVTLFALGFGAFIFEASRPDGPALLKRLLRLRALRWLGKYSYGLYVYHGIVGYALLAHHALPSFERLAGSHFAGVMLQALAGTLLSVLLAVLSFECLEAPFLRLKARFTP